MKRLMLVEDHLAFRQSLACVLKHESDIEVVGQAGSLAEGRDGAAKGANIALIDLDLPDGDGVELIRELSEASTPVAVVALITRYDPARHNQTLRAGAQQVLSKGASVEEIIAALRCLNHEPLTPFSAP